MSRRISMLTAAALAAGAVAGTGTSALAAPPIDFGALTCADFLDATEEGQQVMALWLDGHLSSNPEESKVDLDEILLRVPALRAACADRQDSKITGVYEVEEQSWVAARPAVRE
jgi:hypothetical protein